MKVNLVYGDAGQTLDNYLNINPYGEESEFVRVDGIQNIDSQVDNGELDELIAMDVLEYIPVNKIKDALSNWISKLRVGGKLIVGFVDAQLKAKEFANHRISLAEFNNGMHGTQEKPYLIKRCGLSIKDVSKHLIENHGVTVLNRRINNEYATITFERSQ